MDCIISLSLSLSLSRPLSWIVNAYAFVVYFIMMYWMMVGIDMVPLSLFDLLYMVLYIHILYSLHTIV